MWAYSYAKKILKYFEVPMEFDFTGTVKLNTNNQCRIFFYNFAYFCKPIYSKKLTFKLNYSIFCILCVRMNPYNNRRKKMIYLFLTLQQIRIIDQIPAAECYIYQNN